ncbi:MAG: 6-phosphofructokinase [Thermoprotei archaeon]|nr:6-phosphofructokinase [TACK group archaeon]
MRKIAIATTGGDAPGMNAAIRAITRLAEGADIKVIGVHRGYCGLIEEDFEELNPRSVSGIVNMGGTILRTVRCPEMETEEGIEKASDSLKKNGIDGIIVIGGDGSFRGAMALYKASGIPVVGVPATIDNDINGTDSTIGFDTAVNTALTAIDKIRDTATSHERVFVVEVMGRRRGFLALSVGLAAGAEVILVPEVAFTIDEVEQALEEGRKRGKHSSIIVMAEGAGDSRLLTERIAKDLNYEARLSVLGYMQRGGSPTAISRILANRFGEAAINTISREKGAKMVGIEGNTIVSRPLSYAFERPKPLDLSLYTLSKNLAV